MNLIITFGFSRHTAVTEEEIANSENTQKRIVYQHKIVTGITQIEHYGLSLASKTNLPGETVKLAGELAELIVNNRKVSTSTLRCCVKLCDPE